jgi:hypothetical protein
LKKRILIFLMTLALAVAMVIPMAVPVAAAPSWMLVETLIVDSNTWASGTVTYSQPLVAGRNYKFEAIGTWYANDGISADAKYCTRVWAPTWPWQDACGPYEAANPHICELKVNGAFVDWGALDLVSHTYTLPWIGAGALVGFKIFDINDNNAGSLTVKIYVEVYGISGLLAPYSALKAYKIGSTIPLKWQYTDAEGNVINSADANPSIGWVYEGEGNGSGELEEILDTPGTTGFSYDPVTMTWQFNWQTKGRNVGIYEIRITSFSPAQVNGTFPNPVKVVRLH